MTRSTGQRKFHLKDVRPADPAVKSIKRWLPANRGFYADFRRWLRDGGYSDSALNVYGVAVRLALGWLDQPYWLINPQQDLDRVRDYLATRSLSAATRSAYENGLEKLAEYLRYRCHRPTPEKQINWNTYTGSLPDWLANDVRVYVTHRHRAWLPEQSYRSTNDLLSHLTHSLRWMVVRAPLTSISDLTPARWFEYVDARLAAGIKANTLNSELCEVLDFLRFLSEEGRPVCQRMLRVKPLAAGPSLPRDVPADQLRLLRQEIEAEAASIHASRRRMGQMDRAWFLLMLHSGLRTGEVRRLCLVDLDLAGRRVRIEQSKGLKDRIAYLTPATVEALQIYLEVGQTPGADRVFTYRHLPLGPGYCGHRLRTYGQRCGVQITPHQLRHSCATLLLNAGAPILAVQTLLGHKHIDTTLGYARLYDRTVAADYYRAMAEVEARLTFGEGQPTPAFDCGQLLTLVDTLYAGTLNEMQRATVQTLRSAILALAEQEISGQGVMPRQVGLLEDASLV